MYLEFGGSQSLGQLFDRKFLRLDRARIGSNATPPCGSRIPSGSLLELGLSLAWCSVWSSGIGTLKLALGGPDGSSATLSSWAPSLAFFSRWCYSSSSAHGLDAIPENDHSMGLEGDTGHRDQGKSCTAALGTPFRSSGHCLGCVSHSRRTGLPRPDRLEARPEAPSCPAAPSSSPRVPSACMKDRTAVEAP